MLCRSRHRIFVHIRINKKAYLFRPRSTFVEQIRIEIEQIGIETRTYGGFIDGGHCMSLSKLGISVTSVTLTKNQISVSSLLMSRTTIRARDRLLEQLPISGEILRGSLLHRMLRHSRGCPKCARGGGHPSCVLTVGYPGGRNRQLSLRSEQVPTVRRWLANYRALKEAIEAICELNQLLLRADRDAAKARRKEP